MKARKAQTGLERRDINGEKPVLDDSGKIRGLAIVFDSWTTIGYGPMRFRERVAPGAVTKTLRESDLVYLDNHDIAKPLARKSAGNLDVRVTDRGVEYVADPPDTTYANDLRKNVRAGNILGNSFGFEPIKDKWEIGADGVDERTLLEMKLPEISSCTFPAYEDTEIGMRDQYAAAMEARDRFYASNPESRAAKATYADLHTCGSCGATGQYGAYCGNCGTSMGDMDASPDSYCTSCGAPMGSNNRASHKCEKRANKEPYGDVKYADPGYQKDGKKRYPLDTSKHIHAAWSYINQADNAAEYTSEQLAHIKSAIKAAAKKIGMKISEQKSADVETELRGYDPETGMETRDDPDGDEVAAMHEALARLADGDIDAARQALEAALAGNDEEDDDTEDNAEDSSGMVAHTEQGGAAVELIRAAVNEAYEAVRDLSPTSRTNKILSILEPHLRTPDDEQRGDPKPDASTSEIAATSDSGIELQKRWLDTQREYRSQSR